MFFGGMNKILLIIFLGALWCGNANATEEEHQRIREELQQKQELRKNQKGVINNE